MENCKNLIKEDISSWHADVFDHPNYKYTCELTGKEVIPCIHCNENRCDFYDSIKEEYIEDTYLAVEEAKYRDVPKDKYMIAVFRDEKYYEEHNGYPEDFDSAFLCEKYVFDTPEEFVKKWYKLDEGDWYWCFDKGELFCSGAIDPNDIEVFEDYFDISSI